MQQIYLKKNYNFMYFKANKNKSTRLRFKPILNRQQDFHKYPSGDGHMGCSFNDVHKSN